MTLSFCGDNFYVKVGHGYLHIELGKHALHIGRSA